MLNELLKLALDSSNQAGSLHLQAECRTQFPADAWCASPGNLELVAACRGQFTGNTASWQA
jgi:hypothetical protein